MGLTETEEKGSHKVQKINSSFLKIAVIGFVIFIFLNYIGSKAT